MLKVKLQLTNGIIFKFWQNVFKIFQTWILPCIFDPLYLIFIFEIAAKEG